MEVEPVRCGRVAARCAGPTGPRHRSRRRHRGQSLLEAALGLPLVLVLALGTADGGRAFYYREAVSNAARQALRVAVSQAQRSTGDAVCAGTTTATAKTVSATIPANGTNPNIDTIVNAAGQESSTAGTASSSKISGATVTITWHCLSGLAIANDTATSTDPASVTSDAVEVKVTYRFSLITPLVGNLFGSNTPAIGADVIGRADYKSG